MKAQNTGKKRAPQEPPKDCGQWFKILWPRDREAAAAAKREVYAVARMATYAENTLWLLWRKYDPIGPLDMIERQGVKDQTGKYPPLGTYVLGECPEGKSPTTIARALCPGISSYVYDAVANHVRRLYPKWQERIQHLRFTKHLPLGDHLRIRFRERAVVIREHPDNPHWFQTGFAFRPHQERLWLDLRTVGCSPFCTRWLNELVESGNHPSGGTLSVKRRKGKDEWRVSLARARYSDEGIHVAPVSGRHLLVWAPLDQEVFLRCRVHPLNGRPWCIEIESNDLLAVKRRHEELRARMGRNYHQAPYSAAHGHGRRRALQGKDKFSDRYENRVTNWIENRSKAIVQFACDARCEKILFENLVQRDPKLLRLGSFPYYKLMLRTKQKAKDAGIAFEKFEDLEETEAKLKGGE